MLSCYLILIEGAVIVPLFPVEPLPPPEPPFVPVLPVDAGVDEPPPLPVDPDPLPLLMCSPFLFTNQTSY